jgi:hypothetical protein
VDADPGGEVEPVLASHLLGVVAKRVAQPERCVTGTLHVVLVRDGRAEERHDAVAGVLVDGALEAVHALGQDLEEAVEDAVPRLGVQPLRQLHRTLHVREEHRHVLALALERRFRAEDAIGQVFGRVVER